ncbi:hypothetical protein DPMN_040751, partial [Dreissena polymorpha]
MYNCENEENATNKDLPYTMNNRNGCHTSMRCFCLTVMVLRLLSIDVNCQRMQQFKLKESGNHLCEIVNLAETKDALNAWERTWSSSARSQLIDRKREKGASNGYLEQQNLQPIVLVDHIAGEVEQSVKRKRTSSVNQHVKKRN